MGFCNTDAGIVLRSPNSSFWASVFTGNKSIAAVAPVIMKFSLLLIS